MLLKYPTPFSHWTADWPTKIVLSCRYGGNTIACYSGVVTMDFYRVKNTVGQNLDSWIIYSLPLLCYWNRSIQLLIGSLVYKFFSIIVDPRTLIWRQCPKTRYVLIFPFLLSWGINEDCRGVLALSIESIIFRRHHQRVIATKNPSKLVKIPFFKSLH